MMVKIPLKLAISGVAFAMGLFGSSSLTWAQSKDEESAERHFTLKVLPVLREKCLGCHGGDTDDIKGEYDVRSREGLIRGGESEDPSVVPGKPDESPLYWAVTWDGLEMPPKENDRLTDDQCEAIRKWILDGAPWPDEERQEAIRREDWASEDDSEGIRIATSGGLGADWTNRRYVAEEVWAFQPVRKEFTHQSIDGLIEARLAEKGIEAAQQATPRELVRRAYLDLLGLPPNPEQVQEFLSAWEVDASDAWASLIDELLESPHYGERWAQHWLDVVRYADTAGFSNDYERSNAWRYRDYVVRAFNDDKPYNEFVMEQLAGDELRPDDPEAVIATGFLRMGPWGTAMIPAEEARQLFLDDVVHSVGQSFLSMPLRCCKCHDHKFDPIPTRDYYRIYATFSATQPAEMPAEFLDEENRNGFEEGSKLVNSLHKFADDKRLALVNKRETAAREWYDENELPYKDANQRKNDPEDMKPIRHVGLTEMEQGRLKVREQDEWIWARRKERYQPLAQSVYNGEDRNVNSRKLRRPEKVKTDWDPQSVIFAGGDFNAKGDAVTPGVLSACGLPTESASEDDAFRLPDSLDGRRLALAKWMASEENPLTARSYVNRLWQYHFGQGIVKTSNNFGAKGDAPANLELLDWLATQFVASGWSTKEMHRVIMLSKTYQRSTKHQNLDKLAEVDPDNKLQARFVPRRLTAEEYRDVVLAVTGELNRELGGVPIMPEINMEVALQPRMIQFSIAPAHQPSRTPQERNRRTIYAYRVRGQADPFLEVLNQPNPNESCEMRDTAAVSPQAFTLMNSDVMSDRSIAMALRLEKESEGTAAQVNQAFWLTLGREPSVRESKSLQAYVDEMIRYHQETTPDPTTYPTSVTRSLVEEFSGKVFDYEEWLPIFEDYSPDAKPAAVSAETRALADMCLVLLNSNEFAYVY